MRNIIFTALSIFCVSGFWVPGHADSLDVDSDMMRSTFKIQSGNNLGTVFFIGETITNSPMPGQARYLMVTAAHVLSDMPSSNATVFLRIKDGTGYKKIPFEIQIRYNGIDLWTCNPRADVAMMRVALPSNADMVLFSDSIFADDQFLFDFRIHPGDELRILGFPYGAEANEAGFPILRSGRIAGFPLTPASEVQTFPLDFQVFRGNSGGPVYIAERRYMHDGSLDSVSVFRIMGLISEEQILNEPISSLDETTVKRHALGIGVVVNAEIIKETMSLLPPQ